MTIKTVLDFQKLKEAGTKISIVTAYDFWSARILNNSAVDCLLVGDSLAMVMHGHATTIPATTEMMALHTQSVARGAPEKMILADMPFLSYRQGTKEAMRCIDALMKAGAHAVKLEGVDGHEKIITQIIKSGVPTMGHLGLTPQSIHKLGGPRIQGRESKTANLILSQAKKLEDLGAFSIVLECVPADLARKTTDSLSIPTIGIGAGAHVSGQVLVFHDLLGLQPQFKFRFLRTYLDGYQVLTEALNAFNHDVKNGEFPNETESFT